MKVDIYNTENKYKIIYADPPWRYGDKGGKGACERHYNTMKLKDICELPIDRIADKDCILFIWCTYPMLKEGLKTIESWGFKYKTIAFQWIKTCPKNREKFFFGLGRWTRGNTECCLLATKGKPKRVDNAVSQLVIAPLKRHSEKPDEVRKKINKLMGELPRIEIFARETCNGWDCWGDDPKVSCSPFMDNRCVKKETENK